MISRIGLGLVRPPDKDVKKKTNRHTNQDSNFPFNC
ncbi:unnamed protein product [Debaryomyces tyrocola]|nr:unnamed protein product [Debaryomyces tyrocola]